MNEKTDYKLFVSSSFNTFGNMWTINRLSGITCYVNMKEKSYLPCYFDGTYEGTGSNYRDVLEVNGKLYYLPERQGKTPQLKIRVINGEETVLSLENRCLKTGLENDSLFSQMIQHNDYLYLIPYAYPSVVVLDLKTLDINYIDDWVEVISESVIADNKKGFFFSEQYITKNDKIIIPFFCMPAILEIDVVELTAKVVTIDSDEEGFSGVLESLDGNYILAGSGKGVNFFYMVDKKDYSLRRISSRCDSYRGYVSLKMLRDKYDNIYVFPRKREEGFDVDIYCLNLKTLDLRPTNIMENERTSFDKRIWGDEILYADWKDENTIIYVTGRDLKWHEYNVETTELVEYEMEMRIENEKMEKIEKEIFWDSIENKTPVLEKRVSLDEFKKWWLDN